MNTHNNTSAGLKVLRLNCACFGPGKNSTFQELARFTRQVFKLYYDVRQCFYPISLYGVVQLSIDENELVHSLFAFFVIDGFETFAHSTLKTA